MDQGHPDQPQPNPVNQTEPITTPPTPAEHALSRSERIKRSYFQILIGCLLGAAGIAVFAVLAGSFNDTFARALGTIGAVAVHAVLSFSYITETEKRGKKNGGKGTELFSNVIFTLIAVSFITSVFAIWQLIEADFTFKLYLAYGVLAFATLHADVLYRIRGFGKSIDNLVTANYAFIAIVATMLFIVIFAESTSDLGEFYYRLLAAFGIIDASMTISAAIMHKLYLQKHPELNVSSARSFSDKPRNFWKHPLVIIVLIFLALQVVGSLVALMTHGF